MEKFNKNNFHKKMLEIDEKLRRKGKLIPRRPIFAFDMLSPNYRWIHTVTNPIEREKLKKLHEEYEGINLRDKINDWYEKIYGKKYNVLYKNGETPILIREEIYFMWFPIAYGKVELNIIKYIEDLTIDLAKSFNEDEKSEIKNIFELGNNFFNNTIFKCSYIKKDAKEFLESGISDINTSVSGLRNNPPSTNLSCYHSQQFIEKLLKSFLAEKKGYDKEKIKKDFKHNLEKILKELINDQIEYDSIISSKEFDNINRHVDIRYGTNLSNKEAVETNHSAMRLALYLIEECKMQKYFS